MTATEGDTNTDLPKPSAATANLAQYSRFVQRIRRRYDKELGLLQAGAPDTPAMQSCLDSLLATGLDAGQALRVLRQLVVVVQSQCLKTLKHCKLVSMVLSKV